MKLTVKLKIFLLATLPLLVAMWFMLGTVLTKYSTVNEMEKQAPASNFLINAGPLLKQLQTERSLSLLSSLYEDSQLKQNAITQYSKTDDQIKSFKKFSKSFNSIDYSDKLPNRLKNTMNTLAGIKQLRSDVASKKYSPKAIVSEYSKLTESVITSIGMVIQFGTNNEITNARRALKNYIQAIESVSVIQTVLTRAFKNDSFEDGDYAVFTQIDSEEQTFLEIFYSLATDEQLLAFAIKQSDPVMAETQRIHDIAIEKGIAPESTIHIVSLTQASGYGGAIHNFKNYVLRKDEKYAIKFSENYLQIKSTLAKLKTLFSENKRNLRYLKRIESTIDKYHSKLPSVKEGFEAGLSVEEIDKKININDKGAIIAIGALVNSSLSGNFSIDPMLWFENSDKKLKLMNDIEKLLATQLSDLTSKLEEKAWISLFIMISIISALLIAVSVTVYLVANNIVKPLNETVDFALAIANGDLTGHLNIKRKDEIGKLSCAVNKMAGNLKIMVKEINTTTNQLADAAHNVTLITAKTTQDVTQQQDELQMISTAMNEMSNTVESISRNAVLGKDATDKASDESNNGQQVVTLTSNVINEVSDEVSSTSVAIKELESESEGIGQVLDVIRDIAEQTNLLALNASIEAARAGEQGRGFSVVADEVRVLASRTQHATHDIQQMIERLQSGSSKAVKAMEKGSEKTATGVVQANNAREMLDVILESVSKVSDINALIATSTEKQTATANEINQSISSINILAQETATGANQTALSIDELSNLANNLKYVVEKFKI